MEEILRLFIWKCGGLRAVAVSAFSKMAVFALQTAN